MNDKTLKAAMTEARRFIKKGEAVMGRAGTDSYVYYGSKETAAAKRASLDLTRALAEMRRSN